MLANTTRCLHQDPSSTLVRGEPSSSILPRCCMSVSDFRTDTQVYRLTLCDTSSLALWACHSICTSELSGKQTLYQYSLQLTESFTWTPTISCPILAIRSPLRKFTCTEYHAPLSQPTSKPLNEIPTKRCIAASSSKIKDIYASFRTLPRPRIRSKIWLVVSWGSTEESSNSRHTVGFSMTLQRSLMLS